MILQMQQIGDLLKDNPGQELSIDGANTQINERKEKQMEELKAQGTDL